MNSFHSKPAFGLEHFQTYVDVSWDEQRDENV